ncbi:hypothetical protein GCM10010123_46230 [Pilimelia anulata]|uniref:Uncharacterized protein n=1 Tax=Pilimelia anulata TaxID=53371 RepID=A0A8J3BBY9_9ACTN|nr:hypothetical protein [Pilimelia anulata]GGK11004.1 hypothetical protein GCM10010123_46230 [Pilimelia anulata]
MSWTVKRRLAALGVLAITAVGAVGSIAITQARTSASRAEHAVDVGQALSTTIDAQHTASVILAAASILTDSLTAARRAEVIDLMNEHADELRDQYATLAASGHRTGVRQPQGQFLPTITALLADAQRVVGSSSPLSEAGFETVRVH